MRRRILFCVSLWALISATPMTAIAQSPGWIGSGMASTTLIRETAAHNINALPLSFEINQGQSDPGVKFQSRGAGFSALFKQNETDLLLYRRSSPSAIKVRGNSSRGAIDSSLLRMRLLGAREDASISGEEKLPGIMNYIHGNDPAEWHTGIPTFGRVKYSSVYQGTDLEYYGSNGRLEFDFELAPGADPSAIRMRFEGARMLRLDHDGSLVVVTPDGPLEFHKPEIYQVASNGTRISVPGDFVIAKRSTFGFRVGNYDRSRP